MEISILGKKKYDDLKFKLSKYLFTYLFKHILIDLNDLNLFSKLKRHALGLYQNAPNNDTQVIFIKGWYISKKLIFQYH